MNELRIIAPSVIEVGQHKIKNRAYPLIIWHVRLARTCYFTLPMATY